MTLHPAKWRETCDPFSLDYHGFQLTEILGYPHARNDVFHVRGVCEGQEVTAYIKAARQKESAIDRDVSLLVQLDAPIFPKVLDAGREPVAFSVTQARPGARLSVILGENEGMASLAYMEEYGAALAQMHQLTPTAPPQADRRFYHRPPKELLDKLNLSHLDTYFSRPPAPGATVFCHGDFHYANLLWEDQHISAILDFELSGYGNRDFDIAWAMFRRPGQRFLKTPEEQRLFLQGYARHGEFDAHAVQYYMAQSYVYFLEFSDDDPEYCASVRAWLSEICT